MIPPPLQSPTIAPERQSGNNPIVQETCSDVARMQWAFNYVSGPTAPPTDRVWSGNADGFAATSGMGLTTTTGGAAGATVTVSTYAGLVRYATASTPYVIRVNGTITVTPYGTEIRAASNKTIVGVGTRGHIVNGGFFLGSGVTPNSFYSYTLDPASQLPALLRTYAGPQANIGV
ncbi:hypothetical protein [Acrocarpospora sp. B8E8]|uniref:hypothetical protein n=1 Tax=Acrocarpospora sp. B8E8 TaxID=3153572 RepID=UPI00325C75D3